MGSQRPHKPALEHYDIDVVCINHFLSEKSSLLIWYSYKFVHIPSSQQYGKKVYLIEFIV